MKRQIVIATAILFVMCIIGTTFAEARVGVLRLGIGVGRPGSGIGYRPGIGAGAPGPGLHYHPGLWPGVGGPGSGIGYRPGIGVGAPGWGWTRIPGPR